MTDQKSFESPIAATFDKYQEAMYFLITAGELYHSPTEFRFHLNAFIQAFRNITFLLQSEPNKFEGFDAWYQQQQDKMRELETLRNLKDTRNFIVKKGMLAPRSSMRLGIFRGRQFKLGLGGPIDPFKDSIEILQAFTISDYAKMVLDPEHSAIGEQFGVEREWIVPEIADGEVLSACFDAINHIEEIIEDAHKQYGIALNRVSQTPDTRLVRVILESDVDPSLPSQWGWVEQESPE